MRYTGIAVALLLLSVSTFGQAKTGEKVPKVSTETQIKMLQAQHKLDTVKADFADSGCQSRMVQDQQQFKSASDELLQLKAEAFKEAGLKQEEYELNETTFEFTRKPPPSPPSNPAAPSKPEEKKPQ